MLRLSGPRQIERTQNTTNRRTRAMSSTALVRSTSSSTSLIPPQQQRPASASPSAIIPTTLPKLNLTTQSSNSPSRTQTPQQQRSTDASTPARWQHPRMDEVISRQSRTNFDNSNVRIILWNFAFLILSFFAPATLELMYVSARLSSQTHG